MGFRCLSQVFRLPHPTYTDAWISHQTRALTNKSPMIGREGKAQKLHGGLCKITKDDCPFLFASRYTCSAFSSSSLSPRNNFFPILHCYQSSNFVLISPVLTSVPFRFLGQIRQSGRSSSSYDLSSKRKLSLWVYSAKHQSQIHALTFIKYFKRFVSSESSSHGIMKNIACRSGVALLRSLIWCAKPSDLRFLHLEAASSNHTMSWETEIQGFYLFFPVVNEVGFGNPKLYVCAECFSKRSLPWYPQNLL